MKSERLHLWISRVRGTPAGPVEEVTEVVVGVPIADSGPAVQNDQGLVIAKRVGIVALVVFAPIVLIVIVKVLRDVRAGLR